MSTPNPGSVSQTRGNLPVGDLLLRTVWEGLLVRHGFTDIGSFQLTPVHAVTYGRA